jgi:hypothetical protein
MEYQQNLIWNSRAYPQMLFYPFYCDRQHCLRLYQEKDVWDSRTLVYHICEERAFHLG